MDTKTKRCSILVFVIALPFLVAASDCDAPPLVVTILDCPHKGGVGPDEIVNIGQKIELEADIQQWGTSEDFTLSWSLDSGTGEVTSSGPDGEYFEVVPSVEDDFSVKLTGVATGVGGTYPDPYIDTVQCEFVVAQAAETETTEE